MYYGNDHLSLISGSRRLAFVTAIKSESARSVGFLKKTGGKKVLRFIQLIGLFNEKHPTIGQVGFNKMAQEGFDIGHTLVSCSVCMV